MPTLPTFHHCEKAFLRAPSIKILNQSVSISLCLMIISFATLTTLCNLICASSFELQYIPATLGMHLMSAVYRRNLLTSVFEAWVMVIHWKRVNVWCILLVMHRMQNIPNFSKVVNIFPSWEGFLWVSEYSSVLPKSLGQSVLMLKIYNLYNEWMWVWIITMEKYSLRRMWLITLHSKQDLYEWGSLEGVEITFSESK